MSWLNKAKETKRIHEEGQNRVGKASLGRRKKDREAGWGIRQTADALKCSLREVVENLKLANHYDSEQGLNRTQALEAISPEPRVNKLRILIEAVNVAIVFMSQKKYDEAKRHLELTLKNRIL